MPSEELLLIGRDTGHGRDVLETHAARLVGSDAVESATVATYKHEPYRELRETLGNLDTERVYAIPMFASHTYDTVDELPGVLSVISGEVQYGELLGQSPAVTDVIDDRAREAVAGDQNTSLVLVGLGSNSAPDQQQATEYHAERLRERARYDEVKTCYLMQNPAVECVRYAVSNDRVVAAPMFLAHSEATDEQIPTKLELDRGGIAYADPLGAHDRLTDAIHGELERLRVLADEGTTSNARIDTAHRPLAADGEGPTE
ncbi:CbiX/SirB N-terminal domain-containing protein [Halovenus salina]|uniref:CbiX/SirB N-terminal domain-containing protein n=1 Tax=Halovenus salina TaxID=1510225 RepID=UPI00226103CB|nr:CbiX/SirB N-terminal domain-containing protein [Halovenus salina]